MAGVFFILMIVALCSKADAYWINNTVYWNTTTAPTNGQWTTSSTKQQHYWNASGTPTNGQWTTTSMKQQPTTGMLTTSQSNLAVSRPNYPCVLNEMVNINDSYTRADVGYISSPNYPANYGSNARCRWLISFKNGSWIKITSSSFNTEQNYDFVEIYTASSGQQWKKISGNSFSDTTVHANAVEIRFSSDGVINAPGFQLRFERIGVNACVAQMAVQIKPSEQNVTIMLSGYDRLETIYLTSGIYHLLKQGNPYQQCDLQISVVQAAKRLTLTAEYPIGSCSKANSLNLMIAKSAAKQRFNQQIQSICGCNLITEPRMSCNGSILSITWITDNIVYSTENENQVKSMVHNDINNQYWRLGSHFLDIPFMANDPPMISPQPRNGLRLTPNFVVA